MENQVWWFYWDRESDGWSGGTTDETAAFLSANEARSKLLVSVKDLGEGKTKLDKVFFWSLNFARWVEGSKDDLGKKRPPDVPRGKPS